MRKAWRSVSFLVLLLIVGGGLGPGEAANVRSVRDEAAAACPVKDYDEDLGNHDWDDDGRGDACDPCPLEPEVVPGDHNDTDGNGVSEACDVAKAGRATWVWNECLGIDVECLPEPEALVGFAEARNITELVVTWRKDLPAPGWHKDVMSRAQNATPAIEVHALTGANVWLWKPQQAIEWTDDLAAFEDEEGIHFAGIHIDSEPWARMPGNATAHWNGSGGKNESQWARIYLDLMTNISAETVDHDWNLEVVIPNYLDKRDDVLGGTFHKEILEIVDGVTVLALLDRPMAIVEAMEGEMEAAIDQMEADPDLVRYVRPTVSAKIHPLEYNGFGDDGEAAMNTTLGHLDSHYRAHEAYRGIGIHPYNHYALMRP